MQNEAGETPEQQVGCSCTTMWMVACAAAGTFAGAAAAVTYWSGLALWLRVGLGLLGAALGAVLGVVSGMLTVAVLGLIVFGLVWVGERIQQLRTRTR